jgi:hypothetical protein
MIVMAFPNLGHMSLDHSLYEQREGNPHITDSLQPPVVFEVAYTQTS